MLTILAGYRRSAAHDFRVAPVRRGRAFRPGVRFEGLEGRRLLSAGLVARHHAPRPVETAPAVLHAVDLGLPGIVGVARVGVHDRPTQIILSVNVPLDPARAQNLANYQIVKPLGRAVGITSAVYDPATATIVLTTQTPLSLHRPFKLTVALGGPAGLTTDTGIPLTPLGQNQTGTNFVTTIDAGKLIPPFSPGIV
jgi:hypothetical protein